VAIALAAWGHPTLDYPARATKGWAMTRLDHALLVVGAYLLLVLVGYAMRPSNWRQLSEASGAKPASLLKLFLNEPIRVFQLVYNTTQVRACECNARFLLCAYCCAR
jgi:hypothetical protein